MRYLAVLLLAIPAFGQDAASSDRTLQSLLTEVKSLRQAIERSTLLGARTQLAISQLQMEDARVARIAGDLADVRNKGPQIVSQRAQFADRIKSAEESRTRNEFTTDPGRRAELEGMIRQWKIELEAIEAGETLRATRESELANQLQTAMAQAADARSRIAQMEQALDAAIRALTKPQ